MTEADFKIMLTKSIENSEFAEKREIVNMLRHANIRFEKTQEYTGRKWNHYKEHIYILVPMSIVFELKKHENFLNKTCREIYMPDGDYELFDVLIKATSSLVEEVSQDIIFENIRSQIIAEIRLAKYVIWIAMAWFTDEVLFEELQKKKTEGLIIEIVLDDNDQNRKVGFHSPPSFPTYWVRLQSLYKNTMHDKFCVIDLYTVVHGSFNWTNSANYNKETISIDKNRSTAENFADEFLKLKKLSP